MDIDNIHITTKIVDILILVTMLIVVDTIVDILYRMLVLSLMSKQQYENNCF